MSDLTKVPTGRINGLEATIADLYSKVGDERLVRCIGEVYWSQSSKKTDNKIGLPLFSGEAVAIDDYPDFYAFLVDHPELLTNETTYLNLKADTTKDLPFYLIKDGNIHLPVLRHYIKNANTTDGIESVSAGLPNITGYADVGGKDGTTATGALKDTTYSGGYRVDGSDRGSIYQTVALNLDASDSSAIFGASDTVTPAHSTLYPWVVVVNSYLANQTSGGGGSSEYSAGQGIDITNNVISCSLSAGTGISITNNVISLNDSTLYLMQQQINELQSQVNIMLGRMDYSNAVTDITVRYHGGLSPQTYSVPSDGYIFITKVIADDTVAGKTSQPSVFINDKHIFGGNSISQSYFSSDNSYGPIPVAKDDVIAASAQGITFTFVPQKTTTTITPAQ